MKSLGTCFGQSTEVRESGWGLLMIGVSRETKQETMRGDHSEKPW